MKASHAACVVAVALLAHLPALDGAYTFDDHAVIERNPRLVVHGADDLLALVKSNYWGEAGNPGEQLFRPVPLLTYAAERAVVGAPAPRVARAVNVALHAATALIALALFAGIARDARTGLLGALIFAAHPLHAEAVAGVVGRAELLSLGLGLLALVLHGRDAPLAGLALLLALGSKENAVAILPIALARDLLEGRWRVRALVSLGVGLAVYVALRAWALDALVAKAGARTLGDMTLPHRLIVALAVYRDAWAAVLLPAGGTAAHFPFPRTSPRSIFAACCIQAACLAVVLSVLALGRNGRGRTIALGVVGFELALLPVSNIVPIGVVFAERLLYAPSAWASLAVAALVARGVRGPAARAGFALVVGLLAFGAGRNDRAWHDDHALWERTHARFPDEPRAQLALAEADLDRGETARALALLDAAIRAFPDSQPLKAKACALLAVAVRRTDRARSEALLARARKLAPMNGEIWLVLARVRLEDGDDRAAREAAEGAVALAPESADALLLLGVAQLRTGDAKSAVETFTRAIPRAPHPGEALVNRAEARWAAGDREGALADYRAAAAALPGDRWTLVLIGKLVAAGHKDEARARWGPVRARAPEDARARIDALVGG